MAVLSSFSGSESNQGKIFRLFFFAWLILRLWRWMQHVLPKRQLTLNGLYGVIFQKTEPMATAVRISDPRCVLLTFSPWRWSFSKTSNCRTTWRCIPENGHCRDFNWRYLLTLSYSYAYCALLSRGGIFKRVEGLETFPSSYFYFKWSDSLLFFFLYEM
jgi:hypothetical protein